MDLPDANVIVNSIYEPCVKFTSCQLSSAAIETVGNRIGSLIANLTARKQFFYGIEIAALTANRPTCLDFNEFLPILPAFVSFVWFGMNYWNMPIDDVYSLQLAKHLESFIPVLPHFSAYRLTKQRMDEFLAKDFHNILIVRGDEIHEGQDFIYGREMVQYAREHRKDTISIGVPGYPEGYKSLTNVSQNPVRNIEYLKLKVDAGGEFIITQICYSSQNIIQFIKHCRSAKITVPIVIGIIVPDSFKNYHIIKNKTGAQLPNDLQKKLNDLNENPAKILKFFVDLTLSIIQDVLQANLGIQGVQFFTMNRFRPVQMVLKELRTLKIL